MSNHTARPNRRSSASVSYPVPVLDCDGCGACCMAQCSPPGYVIFAKPPPWIDEIPDDDFDRMMYDSAPAEAKAALQEYIVGLNDEWNHDDVPCCWFDLETLRCRWYEWRPSICREFKIGSEGCRSWRDDYNVDVDRLRAVTVSG